MSKLYANKVISPPAKVRGSSPLKQNTSPSKRRPFVSTTKGAASFGEPPPLPPRPVSPERKVDSASDSTFGLAPVPSHIPIEPDNLSAANVQLLQKQSFRWLNLTSTFWALIVMDAQRNVEKEGLHNFFDVMDWRAHGRLRKKNLQRCTANGWVNHQIQHQRKSILLVYLLFVRCFWSVGVLSQT